MKKFLSLLLVLAMVFSLCACKESKTDTTDTTEATEATPPVVEQVEVLDKVSITWMGSTKEYTVGSKMTIDDFGQLSSVKKTSDEYSFEYNDIGQLTKVNYLNDDPEKVGYEIITYEDLSPVSTEYNPNDGFRSLRNSSVSTEKNESGQIIVMTENNKYTDVDDGSIDTDVTKYEYEYAPDGKISSIVYSKNNKPDHTTEITYDENGNVVEYKNIGASTNSAYLTVRFEYKMVDKTSVTIREVDAFTTINNLETIINTIL